MQDNLFLLPGTAVGTRHRVISAAPLPCRALQALEEYKLLLQQPEPDLLEGAVLIARHRHPMLELTDVVEVLDDLAEQVMPKLPAAAYPLRLVHAISEHLYVNRGFRGNSKSYYDPDNSCINVVLERRLGIPITLSLVYMEVAKRCDLHLHGVNVPGHFLLTPADPELEFFIDAFEGGQVSFLQDAEATLEKIYGRSVKLDPGFLQRKEQIPARVFLARMLNNLKSVYAARKDYSGAYQMSCYLRATRPGDLEEVRDQGFILWHMQRYAECAVALREYLDRAPEDAKDAPKVRRLLRVLRDVDQYADGGEDTPGAGMQ